MCVCVCVCVCVFIHVYMFVHHINPSKSHDIPKIFISKINLISSFNLENLIKNLT